jgi:hypothetical protein
VCLALFIPQQPTVNNHQQRKDNHISMNATLTAPQAQRVSLGHKRLLPKDTLATLAVIEGRAHALIEANTFPFLNGLGHFLPNSKPEEVTEKLEELEREFWAAKKAFLEKYASLRQSASKDWRKMAEKLVKDPERLVATIEASFSYPDQMERFYGFDIQRFQIALPQRMTVELVSASEHQAVIEARQKAAQEAGQKIRSDVQSFVADCVAALRACLERGEKSYVNVIVLL